MSTRTFLLIFLGIIVGFEGYLLAVEPTNRQTFHEIFSKWNHSECKCSCFQQAETMRYILISLMGTAAYCLIFGQNIYVSVICQIIWMFFQIDVNDLSITNIRNAGIQLLFLIIFLESSKNQRSINAQLQKNRLQSQKNSQLNKINESDSKIEKGKKKNQGKTSIDKVSTINQSPNKNKKSKKRQ